MNPNDNNFFFWDLYEVELTRSVIKDPSSYSLSIPNQEQIYSFCKNTRKRMQSYSTSSFNIDTRTKTFRRVAYRLGIPCNRDSLSWAATYYTQNPIPSSLLTSYKRKLAQ